MSTPVTLTARSKLTMLAQMPWMLLIIIFLVGAEWFDIAVEGTTSYVFIGMTVVILFVEIFKSSDVGAMGFFFDQFWAVVALIIATALLSYLWFSAGKEPTFFHWLGFAMILADALLSPVIAYRTALRNFGVPG